MGCIVLRISLVWFVCWAVCWRMCAWVVFHMFEYCVSCLFRDTTIVETSSGVVFVLIASRYHLKNERIFYFPF
ncbi:hypothetical protein QBC34DRAFT_405471 [Podospora aff. communis PSN243]|uniref:Secreted protein n=1 Tax=Podospora aff. communis PSN243 TaxID=3040156 RepID=A0AAV9GKD2_9PEZI|nr:hypothetical protein QBC34DRAFT_405471 [Podospora aff. communis PSN243]